ncbi:MAG: S8 family serine peptidase [Fimbriimonas sp.]
MSTRWSVLSLFFAVATTANAVVPDYIRGELIVRYRPGYSVAAEVAHRVQDSTLMRSIPEINAQIIRLRPGVSDEAAVRAYTSNPAFESVERNVKVTWDLIPNDPLYAEQWGPQKMQVPLVWDLFRGDPAVLVAVLDDGVPRNHPDLAGKVLPGKDYVDGDNDPDPGADGFHGTHVAGIVAANTNNRVGIAGTGFNVRILPVRFNSLDESIAANIWAADNGAKVINMSYGFPGLAASSAHEAATTYAWNKGVLVFSSAGNNNISTAYVPKSDKDVVVIGASTPQDTKAGFSNFGNWVDLAAPGTSILSTVKGGGYEAWDGTSMAAPGAAGVAALLFSAGGTMVNNRIIRDALYSTADPVGNWVVRGRINAWKALNVIPIGREVTYSARSIALNQGNWVGGNVASVRNSDNNFYSLSGVVGPNPQALTGGAEIVIPVGDALDKIRKFTVTVEARGPIGSTNTLFAWNYNTSSYEVLRSFALRETKSTVTQDIPATNLSRYVRNGEFRLISRAIVPNRLRISSLRLDIDLAEVDALVTN